jgi:(2R)-sulfolactate sulfo-lyase subunit alpha
MRHSFLVHHSGDAVGVAVRDLAPESGVPGRIQATGESLRIDVVDAIPLGHKLALRDIGSGQPVIEYGTPIGVATDDIGAGQHVHVHNLKGQRWA